MEFFILVFKLVEFLNNFLLFIFRVVMNSILDDKWKFFLLLVFEYFLCLFINKIRKEIIYYIYMIVKWYLVVV